MSKQTFKVSIEFEYDSEEGAPLTGKPITHPDHAIEAVRDELEAMSPHEFIIKCEVHDEKGFIYAIQT
jgi:hypothetical protein